MRPRLKLLLLAAGVVVLAILVGALAGRGGRGYSSPLRSTYNTDASGCKAFYELLSSTDEIPPVRLRRLDALADMRGVLIIVGPLAKELGAADARLIEKWVRSGNGLLYFAGIEQADRAPSRLERRFTSRPLPPRSALGTYQEMSVLRGGWRAFAPAQRVYYQAPSGRESAPALAGVELYVSRRGPTAVWHPMGGGQVIVCATSGPIQNGFISSSQNLEFLLCALNVLRPGGGRIIFDEYHQGFDRPVGLGELLSAKGLWASVCELAVCGLLYVWLQGRRMSPPRRLEARRRRSAQDYLDAAGSLYRQCCAPGEVADAYRGFAQRALSRRLGLAGGGAGPLISRIAQRSDWRPGRIESVIGGAGGSRLDAREATALVGELDELMNSV